MTINFKAKLNLAKISHFFHKRVLGNRIKMNPEPQQMPSEHQAGPSNHSSSMNGRRQEMLQRDQNQLKTLSSVCHQKRAAKAQLQNRLQIVRKKYAIVQAHNSLTII